MKPTQQQIDYITAALLILLALNFMNWFYYIIIILFIRITILPNNHEETPINGNTILIISFCVIYSVFLPSRYVYGFNSYIKIFSFFLAYWIGRKIIEIDDGNEKKIVLYISILAFGSALLGTLTLVNNIRNFGIYGFQRIMPGFWSDEMLNATTHSALFILLGGVAFHTLVIRKEQHPLKAFTVAGMIILILSAFLNSSRTALFYPILTFLVTYLTYLFLLSKINIRNFILVNLTLIVLFLLYESNVGGIKGFIAELPLFLRMHSENYQRIINDTRFGVYAFFIQHMADYPFGGLNAINPIHYMHNLWLDVYAETGFIAFLFIVLFSIKVFHNVFRIFLNNQVEQGFKLILVGTYLSLFLIFMSEPILLASPWLFVLFCLIGGMTDKYFEKTNVSTLNVYHRGRKISAT